MLAGGIVYKMRIPFNIGRDPRTSPTGKIIVTLTPDGKRMAEEFGGQGGDWDVIVTLNTAGRPMSVGTLAHEAQMGYNECFSACKRLKAKGMIAQMPSGGMMPQ
jgi:hypothetical protein